MLVFGDTLEQESVLEELSTNSSIRKEICLKGGEKAGSKRTSLVKRRVGFKGGRMYTSNQVEF